MNNKDVIIQMTKEHLNKGKYNTFNIISFKGYTIDDLIIFNVVFEYTLENDFTIRKFCTTIENSEIILQQKEMIL